MGNTKEKILSLQAEIVDVLEDDKLPSAVKRDFVLGRAKSALEEAKNENLGTVHAYCCMVIGHMKEFMGETKELAEAIKALTKNNRNYIHVAEKGVTYPENTQSIDPDAYGLYYAINDHFSKEWDSRSYKLSKNGSEGNPIATNLFRLMHEDENGNSLFKSNGEGYTTYIGKEDYKYTNPIRHETLRAMYENTVDILSGKILAFAGGCSASYKNVVMILGTVGTHEDQFLHFAPEFNGEKLDLYTANEVIHDIGNADYVITSNVLNAHDHHLKHNERDEVLAASATLLKKGGMAIHLIEKTSNQSHLNINLSKSLHEHVGQKLVYSYFRADTEMDVDQKRIFEDWKRRGIKSVVLESLEAQGMELNMSTLEKMPVHLREKLINTMVEKIGRTGFDEKMKEFENEMLHDKSDDFRTSMLVMYQDKKTHVTEGSLAKLWDKLNNYSHRFNYYNKPVYVANPGERSID